MAALGLHPPGSLIDHEAEGEREQTLGNYATGGETMGKEVLEKIGALITAAFGLIAALAWNEAISQLVKKYIPAAGPWVYAIIVTILAVLMTIWIGRAVARAQAKK